MKQIIVLTAAALLVSGCSNGSSGTVPQLFGGSTDAWIVTSVSTEFDRSAVPHDDPIHTYDAAVLFNVAAVDPGSGRTLSPVQERLSEYSQFLSGSQFNDFQLAWSGVRSGSYAISRVFQDAARSVAMTCTTNDGRLLPGVSATPVRPGEAVYFGHMVLTMRVLPTQRGDVTHPAHLVDVRYVARPPGIEAQLRRADIDPARVRFISGLDVGCRKTALKRTLGFN